VTEDITVEYRHTDVLLDRQGSSLLVDFASLSVSLDSPYEINAVDLNIQLDEPVLVEMIERGPVVIEVAEQRPAGTSITGTEVVGDDLIVTLSDGRTINAGSVRGLPGVPGVSVDRAEVVSGDLIITLTTGQTLNAGRVEGEPGADGADAFTESSPVFTYASGRVSRIDYASGNYKLFAYTAGVLTQLDYVRPGQTTIRKVFAYAPNGALSSITQTEI
jgi:hypothetical protein